MLEREMDGVIAEFDREIADLLVETGEEAVEYNREYGDYRNRTGNLRASNYYRVDANGLEIGNSAPYADYVEARGYMVYTAGIILAVNKLERALYGN